MRLKLTNVLFGKKIPNTFSQIRYYDVVTDDWEKDEVTIHICGTECPEVYPWLGNPYGEA